MTVTPLLPDTPLMQLQSHGSATSAFARAIDALAGTLHRASSAENAFANGNGNLRDAVYRRAKADVAIEVTAAEIRHAAAALQSILTMQV